jgi:Fur family peroxide stress response transcriptional regulator
MQPRASTMLADLKRAGLKLTPQRIAIVREIADDLTHPTAQALFERLRPAYPTMSFATVYNTLDALVASGLAGSLNAGNGARAVRFDPNTEPHHHAVCDACGTVVDIPLAHLESSSASSDAVASVSGFRVLREERIYRGLCTRCAAASA